MTQPARLERTSQVRNRNHSRAVVALFAAGALLTVAACGFDGDDSSAQHSTNAPSASRSVDPDAAEKVRVLKAYRAMTDAEARTYAKAKLDPKLERFAAHKALADIKVTLFYQQQQGTVMKGEVTRSPKVTAINTKSDPLKAVVTDCADSSQYDEVKKKTGKVIPYKGSRRHVVTSTAQRSKTGEWKFYTYAIDRERTC